jgi:hypothetical protein
MIHKTQSVCKHCKMDSEQGKKPGYTACLANMRYHFDLPHEFEAVAEPASTGEQPKSIEILLCECGQTSYISTAEALLLESVSPFECPRIGCERVLTLKNLTHKARTSDTSAPQTSTQLRKCTCPTTQWTGSEPNDSTCELTEEEHAQLDKNAAPQPVSGDAADKWPQHCDLCNQDMESADDRTEWHGLGNCVPVCMVCMGSGIEPASTARTDGPRLCAICTKNPALKPHGYCQECYTQWYGQTEPTIAPAAPGSVPQAETAYALCSGNGEYCNCPGDFTDGLLYCQQCGLLQRK